MSHDIFVSYAHADDQPPRQGVPGAVTACVEALGSILPSKSGGKPVHMFMDHTLAPNAKVTSTLRNLASTTRTLLVFMSQSYLNSEWCLKEVNDFLDANPSPPDHEDVFIVEYGPTAREAWPPRLKELNEVRMFETNRDGTTRFIGWPEPPRDDSATFWRKLNSLAERMGTHLKHGAPKAPGWRSPLDLSAFARAWGESGKPMFSLFETVADAARDVDARMRVGDLHELRLRVPFPGFLTLLLQGPRGSWTLAYPGSADWPGLELRPAHDYIFPDELRAQLPPDDEVKRIEYADPGMEVTVAICMSRAIEEFRPAAPGQGVLASYTDAQVAAVLAYALSANDNVAFAHTAVHVLPADGDP